MNDPELKAITEVTKAIANLTEEQRRNVLLYVNARYGGKASPFRASSGITDPSAPITGEHESIGDLFDAANPKTESERVLVAGYWSQVVEGAADFESFPVNQHLKNLGHSVSNITRAIDTMLAQSPRYVLQVSKSGSAKQARKRYKLTREGVKRVQTMLAEKKGDADGTEG